MSTTFISNDVGTQASGALSRRSRTRRRLSFSPWLFCVPALALLVIFLVIPFAMAAQLSLTNQRLTSPLPRRWIGLENYREIFADAEFRRAVLNNLVFAAVIVPVQTGLALGLALIVNQKIRGIAFFRVLFFTPVVMGIAVASTVWFLLFDPSRGLVNGVLRVLSWGNVHPRWLDSTSTALPAIMIVSVWASVGFQMVVLLAGLQDVSTDLYEAASVDGARPRTQFRYITLPAMRNTLVFVLTMTTIFSFRLFDQVYIMTQGGPLGHTDTMLLELVKVGYERQQVARACAIAVVFFTFVVVITVFQRLVIKEDET